jgi:hypothetical protein
VLQVTGEEEVKKPQTALVLTKGHQGEGHAAWSFHAIAGEAE